ncbi:MAG: hypothetical protein IKD55_02300 [Sediminibacterium sp.]|nr:hypothetical protein [Sediminibacterium sp.]
MAVNPYEPIENVNEWHDYFTLQLGECIEDGIIDFSLPDYDFDSFDNAQRNRVYDLITQKYYYFELGIMPVKVWQNELLNTLNLEMLQLKPLYQAIKDGYDLFTSESEWYKGRHVFSDFPQTRLSSQNQDYASTANDNEHEIIRTGDMLDRYIDYVARWKHPDSILVDAVKTCFCGLVSVSLNVY